MMGFRKFKAAAEHAKLLTEDLEDIAEGRARGRDFERWMVNADEHLAQVAKVMGYELVRENSYADVRDE
jgi:hypothetical protein